MLQTSNLFNYLLVSICLGIQFIFWIKESVYEEGKCTEKLDINKDICITVDI